MRRRDAGTDFNFGWNDAANNAAPWGGTATGERKRPSTPQERGDSNDPVAVSEFIGSRFAAVITDAIQADAFERHLLVGLDKLKQELKDMALPAPKQNGGGGGGNPSRPRSSGSKRSGFEFLKNEHLSEEFQDAKIIAMLTEPDEVRKISQYNDVIVKIAMKGKQYLWGLTAGNPNYEAMHQQFGSDENDWLNQTIQIGLESDDFSGKQWARVRFPDQESKPAPRKKK